MYKRLATVRKDLELTQAEFGEKLNLTRSTIANIETGHRDLTERTIADVCRVFNVNETWLRTGDGPMYRPPMTVDNMLMAEIGKLIGSADEDDEFIKNYILEYLKLSKEAKKEVKEFIKRVSEYAK